MLIFQECILSTYVYLLSNYHKQNSYSFLFLLHKQIIVWYHIEKKIVDKTLYRVAQLNKTNTIKSSCCKYKSGNNNCICNTLYIQFIPCYYVFVIVLAVLFNIQKTLKTLKNTTLTIQLRDLLQKLSVLLCIRKKYSVVYVHSASSLCNHYVLYQVIYIH